VPARPETDNTAINEITKQVVICWRDIEKLNDLSFQYHFFVIDNEGNLCYQTDRSLPNSLQSAIRQGFLPMDITIDKDVIGKVIIETFPESHINQAQRNLSNAAIIAFVLLCALIISTFYILYVTIIRPFSRLEGFAHKISTGKFDEPLPMDRNNMFGLFSQSFDVMRTSLLEAREKQIIAERAQKELIASLNHDIKTPITSISLISELLQAGGVDPAIEEKL
jgi:signal transduction histidine kinase